MKQGRDLGLTIVWQYIIFGYNEHEVDEAIQIAKQEDFSLLLINTNRGFNRQFLLRKNVNFKLIPTIKNIYKKECKKNIGDTKHKV